MAALVSGLGTAFLKGEELIAHINEGGGGALATKFEIEQSTVEDGALRLGPWSVADRLLACDQCGKASGSRRPSTIDLS